MEVLSYIRGDKHEFCLVVVKFKHFCSNKNSNNNNSNNNNNNGYFLSAISAKIT